MLLYDAQKQLILNGLLQKVTFKDDKFWIRFGIVCDMRERESVCVCVVCVCVCVCGVCVHL